MAIQNSTNKRRKGGAGVKALIASASVAATIAAWALLPSNDPQSTQATAMLVEQPNLQPTISVPATTEAESTGGFTQLPEVQIPTATPVPFVPDTPIPQVQVPQGSSNPPAPFTRSHSSR